VARDQATPDLRALHDWLSRRGGCLPTEIDVAAVGVREKAPFFVLCLRECLLWRVEELSRNATAALERGDEAVGIILARCVTEAAAMMWRLLKLIENRAEHGISAINEDVRRMWLGWKVDPDDLPEAINVMTMLRHLDRDMPGVLKAYDHLSEFAHPNWNGVAGLYCRTDYEDHIAYFGRQARGDSNTTAACNLLVGALGTFEHAYNELAEVIPVWLSELTPMWADDEVAAVESTDDNAHKW